MTDAQTMWTEDGPVVLIRGHNLTQAELDEAELKVLGEPRENELRLFRVEEVYFGFSPRVKWCERYNGWGCDQDGDWHRVWYDLKPTEDESKQYTIMTETFR